MSAYIEIVSAVALWRFELTDNDLRELREIGEFTRENVSKWMKSSPSHSLFEVGVYGFEDFHAVCGDMDIPWATPECRAAAAMSDDEAREYFRRLWDSQWHEVPSEENTRSWVRNSLSVMWI